MQSSSLLTPVGRLLIHENAGQIVRISWSDPAQAAASTLVETPSALLREAKRQIDAYFDRKLERFDLPLQVEGSAFQQKVCAAMLDIPFGDTRTYGDLARDLGAAAQA